VRVDTFDFDLPEECIALRPAEPRDAARLLVVDPAAEPTFADARFSDLPQWIRPGDALVFNDTKVIAAQLSGYRDRDGARAKISLTLHKRAGPARWLAFARPARKLNAGDRLILGGEGEACLAGRLDGTVAGTGEGGEVTIDFDLAGAVLDEAIAASGDTPLPPYIASRRETDRRDRDDYQTIFARHEGAVAAPTAALHFTDQLMAATKEAGASHHFLTLHVGAGTFLPVSSDDTADHRMHAEWGEIDAATAAALNAARKAGGRLIAVGTTTLRLLESAACADGTIAPFCGETDIFITPGTPVRAVDMLITNFHLPRSTLFMLVCAFSGTECMKQAYAHAVASQYRFYSYGDACLLMRAGA